MKNNFLHLIFELLILLIGTGLEVILPKLVGVGFPILLFAVAFVASRHSLPLVVVFAIVAGMIEDSISFMPFMTSISFYLIIAAISRWANVSSMIVFIVYPMYQIWMMFWVQGISGKIFVRVMAAMPIGLVTALVLGWLLLAIERKAALGDKD